MAVVNRQMGINAEADNNRVRGNLTFSECAVGLNLFESESDIPAPPSS